LKDKSLDEIKGLLSEFRWQEECYAENDTIFSPVRRADGIGIILSGTVDVQKIFPSGKMVLIERKRTSDLIGESSIFSGYEYYPDNICACKPAKVLFVPKQDLLRLFELDDQFLFSYLEAVSKSTLMLKYKIGILSLDSIQEKIAGYLLHSLQPENRSGGTDAVMLPFSKRAWAEYLDVSRTSLSRELRKLENAGIISFEKRAITIRDIDRLGKIISL
jgi:CRP-like cAMP-binding protein